MVVVVRRRLEVKGSVQGVGFRPFAARLAAELGLVGLVGNDAGGAFVEVEGPLDDVERFARRLREEAPPLALIEAVLETPLPPLDASSFAIVPSLPGAGARTLVPPDTATCEACLTEVDDPANRRHRHPFANCTDCGPRFTIVRGLPYDRPQTTMAGFELCPACAAEYADPHDRRYHAQPIACPDCGPRLVLHDGESRIEGTERALAGVQAAWADGRIVAIKGIGGYHLTCDAGSDAAVARLRERKGRGDKPFAVMVRDLEVARALAEVGAAEEAALLSAARPIVLLRRRDTGLLSTGVAPRCAELGLMLPYSPLHHLLFRPVPAVGGEPPRAIVATSGNRADEPIAFDDVEARTRLHDLADAFLVHDRPIHVPCDDSVVRVVDGHEQPVRRSRGYAPLPVPLPVPVAPTLAVGGELKNTFCVATGDHAWLSQHIGDLGSVATLDALERSVAGFRRMYRIDPEVVACDEHPGYLSRRWALEHRGQARLVEVQHHHAHVAALMAEHGLDGSRPVIGVAFDGTGFGRALDGGVAVWGGEVLIADYDGYRRVGHLAELPLPGGDAAVVNPCRLALAYLTALGIPLDTSIAPVAAASETERRIVVQQVERRVGVVPTTSAGRLFDVVASLLGVRQRVTYEGQAAIELEALAAGAATAVELTLERRDGVLDPAPLLRAIVASMSADADPAALALGFHVALADAVAELVEAVAGETGLDTVALTGGVFQNTLLGRLCRGRLRRSMTRVLEHRLVPPNDGGLALGQAIVAGRLVRGGA